MRADPGLERECRIYTRYLIGREPDAYIARKYIECHELGRIPAGDAFDRVLIAASVRNPFLARAADAYASRFRKYGALRKKLVLTLALLECSRASFESLDEAGPGGVTVAVARMAWRAAVFAGALAIGMVLFTPARLLARSR